MADGDISRGMKHRVMLRINDPAGSSVTEAQIYNWLSEACLDIIGRVPAAISPALCATYSWGLTTSLTLEDGVSDYDLPADFLWDRNLSYTRDSVTYTPERLAAGSMWTRGQARPAATVGDSYYWIWDSQIHIDVGAVAATDIMRLFYVKRPPGYVVGLNTSLVDDSDFSAETGALGDGYDPLISPLFYPAVEDFAVARCLEMRGYYPYAQQLITYYEQKIQQIAARFRAQEIAKNEGRPKE